MATIAPPAFESSGARASAIVTSPSTAAGTASSRLVEIRRAQPTRAASGTSAAVRNIALRVKSAISVVRSAAQDPLLDDRQRPGASRARRGGRLTGAEGRIRRGGEPQLRQQKRIRGVSRLDQDETARGARTIRSWRVHERVVGMAEEARSALDRCGIGGVAVELTRAAAHLEEARVDAGEGGLQRGTGAGPFDASSLGAEGGGAAVGVDAALRWGGAPQAAGRRESKDGSAQRHGADSTRSGTGARPQRLRHGFGPSGGQPCVESEEAKRKALDPEAVPGWGTKRSGSPRFPRTRSM